MHYFLGYQKNKLQLCSSYLLRPPNGFNVRNTLPARSDCWMWRSLIFLSDVQREALVSRLKAHSLRILRPTSSPLMSRIVAMCWVSSMRGSAEQEPTFSLFAKPCGQIAKLQSPSSSNVSPRDTPKAYW